MSARRPGYGLVRDNGLRRFTAHFALHQAASALAGAFIGAYLLRSGLPLPVALLVYAQCCSLKKFILVSKQAPGLDFQCLGVSGGAYVNKIVA
jgi:hypothetical protein